MNTRAGMVLVAACLTGCSTTYRTHGTETLAQIQKNPSAHLGSLFAFEGRVIQAEANADGEVFQVLVRDRLARIGSGSLIVTFAHTRSTVARDHEVKVLGHILGSLSGKNAFGGAVDAVAMNAIAVWDLTAGRVMWLKEAEETKNQWESGELFSK